MPKNATAAVNANKPKTIPKNISIVFTLLFYQISQKQIEHHKRKRYNVAKRKREKYIGLAHSRHSGRKLAHEHTSYAALTFVVMLVGVFLSTLSLKAGAVPPYDPIQDQFVVTANVVTGLPPTPVIVRPDNGQHFAANPVNVTGTCSPTMVVNIYRNQDLAGSTICTSQGTFALYIDLTSQANDLVARQINSAGQVSPDSNTVRVYLDGVFANGQLLLRPDTVSIEVFPTYFLLKYSIEIRGGSAPYSISWDWGDGAVDVLSQPTSGLITRSHRYANLGTYQLVIKATDAAGNQAYLQLVAIAKFGSKPVITAPTGVLGSIVGGVSQLATKSAKGLRNLPKPLVQTFPYLLFLILIVTILILLYQTRKEAKEARLLLAFMEKLKQLTDQKASFITLSAHYLRTPLTLITSGTEMLGSLGHTPAETLTLLRNSASGLGHTIERFLKDIHTQLQTVQAPAAHDKARTRALTSALLLVPVIGVALLSFLINWILVRIGVLDALTIQFLTQIAIYILLSVILYVVVRGYLVQHHNRVQAKQLYDFQAQIDYARNQFIFLTTTALSRQLRQAELYLAPLDITNVKNIREGINRLQAMVAKFKYLTELETAKPALGRQEFRFTQLSDHIKQKFATIVARKHLVMQVIDQDFQLFQNPRLLEAVVEAVVDNAVKFSQPGGSVEIKTQAHHGQGIITITDHGVGMAQSQLAQLFTPFSKTSSRQSLTEEGLGFSLFLAKAIMTYLDGEIAFASHPGSGTTVTIKLPLVPPYTKIEHYLTAKASSTGLTSPLGVVGWSMGSLAAITALLALASLAFSGLSSLLVVIWPLYFLILFMLVSFWLGERYEVWYIRRYLGKGGLQHGALSI